MTSIGPCIYCPQSSFYTSVRMLHHRSSYYLFAPSTDINSSSWDGEFRWSKRTTGVVVVGVVESGKTWLLDALRFRTGDRMGDWGLIFKPGDTSCMIYDIWYMVYGIWYMDG